MASVSGIGHIHLHVADVERSIRFYQEAFGFREHFRVRSTMVFLGPENSVCVVVHEDPDGEPGKNGGIDHFGLDLAEPDLDAALADVERAGGRVLERGEHAPEMPYAYISDPDGYRIEL